MAIPFFSIDMSGGEWPAYLGGILNYSEKLGEPSSELVNGLRSRFPRHQVILLPSARLGFYLLLEKSFKAGDEIIFSAMSFPLYVKIAIQLGLVPVLVDVESEHLTIDVELLRRSITNKTKAIVVTHLFGHPARIREVVEIAHEWKIPVIEDCAQSYDSFVDDQETGTFGWVGIFSSSLMKVPTTLGGGILITTDIGLAEKIRLGLEGLKLSRRAVDSVLYHAKGLISILNSYPMLYTLLSHQVLGLIKKKNPALLRQILYSGMGMAHKEYDPGERPSLAEYQLRVGAVQFERVREMTEARRRNSAILDDVLSQSKGVTIFRQEYGAYWNYQYHVIDLGSKMNSVFDLMFARGIHVMKEDVWDCTVYQFPNIEGSDCLIAKSRNTGLLRIQNNSFLSEKTTRKFANDLSKVLSTV
jgi:dTDP-4-amino-4,6-dideoxygalactose transaminase